MAHNFLEQMISEWYEYRGYFVRRNVLVGKRLKGGYECELDIVAFHPGEGKLVHIEPSTDADSWETRERRYSVKFEAGQKFIPSLFKGFQLPDQIDQIAVLVFGSKANHRTLAGAELVLAHELLCDIVRKLRSRSIYSEAVSEQYPILRSIQFMCEYKTEICPIMLNEQEENELAK